MSWENKKTGSQKLGEAFYRLAEETLNDKVIAIEDENKELRKQLNLADVVGQREQLIAFAKYVIDFGDDVNGTPETIVDEFLKSN